MAFPAAFNAYGRYLSRRKLVHIRVLKVLLSSPPSHALMPALRTGTLRKHRVPIALCRGPRKRDSTRKPSLGSRKGLLVPGLPLPRPLLERLVACSRRLSLSFAWSLACEAKLREWMSWHLVASRTGTPRLYQTLVWVAGAMDILMLELSAHSVTLVALDNDTRSNGVQM